MIFINFWLFCWCFWIFNVFGWFFDFLIFCYFEINCSCIENHGLFIHCYLNLKFKCWYWWYNLNQGLICYSTSFRNFPFLGIHINFRSWVDWWAVGRLLMYTRSVVDSIEFRSVDPVGFHGRFWLTMVRPVFGSKMVWPGRFWMVPRPVEIDYGAAGFRLSCRPSYGRLKWAQPFFDYTAGLSRKILKIDFSHRAFEFRVRFCVFGIARVERTDSWEKFLYLYAENIFTYLISPRDSESNYGENAWFRIFPTVVFRFLSRIAKLSVDWVF
jgi:hypothetical protein